MPSRDRAVRRAGALAGARAHLPADPARAVERPRRRPRRRAGGRRPAEVQPVRRAARAARRRRRDDGAVRPAAAREAPGARAGPHHHRPGRAGRGPPVQEGRAAGRRAGRARRDRRAPVRARPHQAGAAEARLAGRGPCRVRRRRGAPDRARAGRLGDAALPAGGGRGLLARRVRSRRPALRRRQDDRRRGRDGRGEGDDADPGHQHGRRAAVAARAAQAHDADRGRDRRVLRRAQGDPAGHHRDVPGDDDPPEGRLHPPRAARRPRLGSGRVRRGAPAARTDLPDDRRPAGPPPTRADRDPGARGRPRGRRLLADRAEAVRRAVEGHRGAGLHRAGRLRRGARDAHRVGAAGLRDRRAGGALPVRVVDRVEDPGGGAARRAAPQRPDAGHRAVPRPARRPRRAARCAGHQGRDDGEGAGAAVPGVPDRRDLAAGGVEGRELLDRPAGGRGRHPGVGHVRVAAGGGAAARPGAAARRPTGAPRGSTP